MAGVDHLSWVHGAGDHQAIRWRWYGDFRNDLRRGFQRRDAVRRQSKQEQALSSRGHLCLVASVDCGYFLQLLPARRPERDQLLGALELLVVGLEHRAHREVLHLRVGQLGAEDDRQRLTATHRGAELNRHLTHDPTDECVHFRVAVRVGHDGPRDRQTRAGRLALDVGELDPGALDRFRRQ